ncbi:MAG: helix-turn-helix domain-containing protein [Candidatus Dormibacteria bacterium]
MASPNPDLLTIREVAARVGRTPETVRGWVWSGRLPARKRGNRLVVTDTDLRRAAAFIQEANLAEWLASLKPASTRKSAARVRSAADLVLEDRRPRSATIGSTTCSTWPFQNGSARTS